MQSDAIRRNIIKNLRKMMYKFRYTLYFTLYMTYNIYDNFGCGFASVVNLHVDTSITNFRKVSFNHSRTAGTWWRNHAQN